MGKNTCKISTCYRYEIYIPLNYNDGRLIEQEKMYKTTDELMNKFGGLTTYPVSLKASGLWKEGDKMYHDQMMVYRVDIEVTNDMLCFFIMYKGTLIAEYEQVQIYMTRQQIELI